MNGNPNKKQQDFQDWARNSGCILSGDIVQSFHHIKGARMKLKGVKGLAGEWYGIPLSYWNHQDGKNSAAIHQNKALFEDVHNITQKGLWQLLMNNYFVEHGEYPMSEAEYKIIVDRA